MFHHCDRCESPATVHLTEIKGGTKAERHLCQDCARALQVPQAAKELQKLLKSFEPQVSMAQQQSSEPSKTCPDCGMTYAEFRKHGRFGCARDYEVFGKDVTRLLKRIHKSSVYTGPAPGGGFVEQGQRVDEMSQVRARLDVAVKNEDYEEAARLRDELRRMTSPGDGQGEIGSTESGTA